MMEAVLRSLLEITVYSTLIIAAIWVFRRIWGKLLSPAFAYAVWFLLVARLLLPVTVESGFHLESLFPQPQAQVQPQGHDAPESVTPDAITPEVLAPESMTPETEKSGPMEQVAGNMPAWNQAPQQSQRQGIDERPQVDWQPWLAGLWLAGMIAHAGWLALSYARFLRQMRAQRCETARQTWDVLDECRQMLGIKRRIRLVTVKGLLSPALMGRTILLPHGMANVRLAILHELTHVKRGDRAVCLLIAALKCAYWFNPLVRWAFGQMISDMETACDARVMRQMSQEEKRDYLATIISLFSAQTLPLPGMAKGRTQKMAKRRIQGAFMRSRTGAGAKAFAFVLAALLLVTGFTTACQRAPDAPADASSGIQTAATPPLPESAGNPFPSRYTGSYTQENVSVVFDAAVENAVQSRYPLVAITPGGFTQAQADTFIDMLIGDRPIMKDGRQSERILLTPGIPIAGEVDMGGASKAEIYVCNFDVNRYGIATYGDGSMEGYKVDEPNEQLQPAMQKAREELNAMLEQMGIDDMRETYDYFTPESDASLLPMHWFVMEKYIEGLPVIGENRYAFENSLTQELVAALFDENGLKSMEWQHAYEIKEAQNAYAALLPWQEMMSIAQRELANSARWHKYGMTGAVKRETIQVDCITLAYLPQGSEDTYRLVPVWQFFGTAAAELDAEKYAAYTNARNDLTETEKAAEIERVREKSLQNETFKGKALIVLAATDGALIRRHGLEIDNVAYALPTTLEAMQLQPDAISRIQRRLAGLRYLDQSAVNGQYDDATRRAVEEFQLENGLVPDGFAGKNTLSLLYSGTAKHHSNRTERVNAFLQLARSKEGAPFELNAKGPDAFDCGGFVYWCLQSSGVRLRNMTSVMWAEADYETIGDMKDIQAGDILCFEGHVGIALGDGTMIDASSSNNKVRITSLNTSYWQRNFVCAKRVIV